MCGIAGAFFIAIVLPKINSSSKESYGIRHEISKNMRESPLRIRIPKLKIDTLIEPVGKDEQGHMAAPRDAQMVSWYQDNATTSAQMNMVLAGHVDDAQGGPGVFAKLTTLSAGDTIEIQTVSGKTQEYFVFEHKSYPYDTAPLEEIFGPSDEQNLVMITCSGEWDEITRNYSQREVIYAKRLQHLQIFKD